MKKMLFSAIAMVAFASSAFASNEVVVEALSKTNEKPENEKPENETVPCRWRTVTTYPDGSKHYGPWIEGRCFENQDGTLRPLNIVKLIP